MIAVISLSAVACAFWFVMFSPWTKGLVPFWPLMIIACLVLTLSALMIEKKKLAEIFTFKVSYIFVGIISAAVLYLVFYAGNIVSTMILPFADSQIAGIYSTREQLPTIVIAFMLFFIIAPAEEIFWRGFVQRRLSTRFGAFRGYLAAAIVYTVVHVWSFNLMLLAASVVCGLYWGYMFKKFRSVWPVIISHAIWDVVIFTVLPIQ